MTPEMEFATARALAAVVRPEELEAEYIVPSVFDRDVARAVAAVAAAAERAGVARKSNRQRALDLAELPHG